MTPDQVAAIAAEIFGPPTDTSRASKWGRYNCARVDHTTGECDLENGHSVVGVPIEVLYDVHTDIAKKGNGSWPANRDQYLAELGIAKEDEEEPEEAPQNDLPDPIITPARKAALRARGITDKKIAQLPPARAHEFLAEILEPDRDQLEIYIQALFRHCDPNGVVCLRSFYQSTNKLFRNPSISLKNGLKFLIDAAEIEASWAANCPNAVVFCPPVATFKASAKWQQLRQEDLLEGPVLAVDLDKNPRAALAKLEQLLGPATLVVRSGGQWTDPATGEVEDKLHAYWRLKEPAQGEDLKKLKELRRLAHVIVGGDLSNVPINHPIRWPGSWHRKDTPRLCEIVSTDHLDNEIDLDVALAALEAVAPQPREEFGEFEVPAGFEDIPFVDLWGNPYPETAEPERIAAALAVIPNSKRLYVLRGEKINGSEDDDLDWHGWITIGMALWRGTGGSKEGEAVFLTWSRKWPKYIAGTEAEKARFDRNTAERWEAFRKCPPKKIRVGTIFWLADQASPGWRQEYDDARKGNDQGESGGETSGFGEIPVAEGFNLTASGGPQPQPPGAPVFDPWQRYIVPPFPLDILPPVAQDYVKSQATIIGCDISGLAMCVLGAFSGALHHQLALKMQRHGKWYERPRLWLLNVADPSQRKTPTLKAATRSIVDYEIYLRDKYDAELRPYEEAMAQGKEKDQLPQKPKEPPRYVVWDTSVEKLGELLARNPKGLLVLSDEISFWLGSMERYSNSAGRSDRGFWLQAYDGGPHNVDRIRRGSIHIKNLSVSLLGCIQPERLAEMQGLTSDGLLQRFVPVMWGPATFTQDRPCDDEAYDKLVREMIFAKPARLIMDDAALAVMTDLRQHLFDIEQTSGGLAAGFQTWVGKLHGIAGSLALILHMAHDPQTGATYAIEEQTVKNVRQLMLDFILPHGYEFYQQAAGSERLRQLASWILTSGKQRIVSSDITRNVADCRGLTLRQLQERLSPLVAAGWLNPAEERNPLCRAWIVTPQVHAQLAERAKIEAERKAKLVALMRRAMTENPHNPNPDPL